MPIKRLYIFLILFFGLFFVSVGLNKVYAATGAVCGCPSQCGQITCGSQNNSNCSATELCIATYGSSGGLCGADYTGNCDSSVGSYSKSCRENHSSLGITYSCNSGLYTCKSSSGCRCVNSASECDSNDSDNTPPTPKAPSAPPITVSKLLGSVGAILYPLGIGIGLFFIIKAGYEFMTSEGEPQKVKAAQEDLTSAVVGLIFIVLSTVILNIIINSLIGG